MRHSAAWAATCSSRALLPMPASPWRTSTPLVPLTALAISASSASVSARRPTRRRWDSFPDLAVVPIRSLLLAIEPSGYPGALRGRVASGVGRKHLAQLRRERIRLSGRAIFAAQEPVVAAGECDRRIAKALRHGLSTAMGERSAARGADSHHDPRGSGANRIEVGLVVSAGDDVLADERVGPGAVVLRRQAEHGGIDRAIGEVGRHIALMHDEHDEFGHRRAHAIALVGRRDVLRRREGCLPVRQQRGERRFVSDEDPDVVRVAGDEGQRVDRATAAREEVDRATAQRLDHRVDVVGVLLRRRLGRGVVLGAALDAPRVVRRDRPVREVARERHEAAGAHWRADEEQHRLVRRAVVANVVRHGRAGYVDGLGRDCGHRCRPFRHGRRSTCTVVTLRDLAIRGNSSATGGGLGHQPSLLAFRSYLKWVPASSEPSGFWALYSTSTLANASDTVSLVASPSTLPPSAIATTMTSVILMTRNSAWAVPARRWVSVASGMCWPVAQAFISSGDALSM